MAVSITALINITVDVSDANRNGLVIAQAQDQSFSKTALTQSTGRTVTEVPIGDGDFTIPLAGITTVNSFYLNMTDAAKGKITLKLSDADNADQIIQGRLFAIQDVVLTAIKVKKHATIAYPIEYILAGV